MVRFAKFNFNNKCKYSPLGQLGYEIFIFIFLFETTYQLLHCFVLTCWSICFVALKIILSVTYVLLLLLLISWCHLLLYIIYYFIHTYVCMYLSCLATFLHCHLNPSIRVQKSLCIETSVIHCVRLCRFIFSLVFFPIFFQVLFLESIVHICFVVVFLGIFCCCSCFSFTWKACCSGDSFSIHKWECLTFCCQLIMCT